jgi:uncharacterized membrane protein YcaP (DUF421 family)
MDAVVRAAVTYVFLVVLFRVTGRRTLAQITTFDFVLLLIVSEATQQGLLGNDFSITNAFLVILTLIGLDLLADGVSRRWRPLDRWLNGLPLVLVEDGKLLENRTRKTGFQEDEILEQARANQGIERMEQIKYAILERNGSISVIPKSESGAS